METLNAVINQVNTILWSYILIVLLIGLGLYFTFRTGFIQIRLLVDMVRLLAEGVGTRRMGNQISSFQAFCVSTASRVGVGNIAGVAIAIVLGGPGAIFWMWMVAIVGSATGFVESTLAQIYKIPRGKWTFHGGPAYYIQNVLHMPNLAKLFSLLLMTTFALVYNSLQANTITLSLHSAFGWDRTIVGVVVSILIALVICGGAHFVARVAEMLVPVMAGAYLLIALIVVIMNFGQLPSVFALIVSNAFAPQAAVAGGFGACVMNGIKRGLFSNEAGEGSVPNAAATAYVTHPVKQGLIQAFGVYVDTLLICSTTVFLILLTGDWADSGYSGIPLLQQCVARVIGPIGIHFVTVIVCLFAFTSIIGNYFYAEANILFITKNKMVMTIFRIAAAIMVFIGAGNSLDVAWSLADITMGLEAVVNIIAILLLGRIAFAALDDYEKQKEAGLDPVFHESNIGLHDTDVWKDPR